MFLGQIPGCTTITLLLVSAIGSTCFGENNVKMFISFLHRMHDNQCCLQQKMEAQAIHILGMKTEETFSSRIPLVIKDVQVRLYSAMGDNSIAHAHLKLIYGSGKKRGDICHD